MTVYPDDGKDPNKGATVKCEAPSPPCLRWENVEGHGKNPKEAHEIACEKYRKPDDK